MDYRHDPVHRTMRWLRARPSGGGSFAQAWAERAGVPVDGLRVRARLTNYKPFERARVVAEVVADPGARHPACLPRHLSLHVAPTPSDARREIERARSGGQQPAVEPILLEERAVVVWALPHVPALDALAELVEPARFRAWAAKRPELATARPPELVRYVPLKRALLVGHDRRCRRRLWWKLINRDEAAGAALNLREVRAWHEQGAFAMAVPRLVHHDPERHVLAMSEVPGGSFTDLLTAGRREPFAQLGRALAELHGVKAVPWRDWSFAGEHAGLRRHLAGAQRAVPAQAGRIEALVDRLERDLPLGGDGFAPIHGNLFGDQILFDECAPAGRRVGLVDWDAWCYGDPHFDLGRLLAHLVFAARREGRAADGGSAAAFLDGYRAVAGAGAIDEGRLRWQLATALLLRAKISGLRKLAPGWPRLLALMTAEAEAALDGRSDVLPDRRRSGGHLGTLELAPA